MVTQMFTIFGRSRKDAYPKGSRYSTIMELGPQSLNKDGLLGPNPIMVVYMEPLGTNALLFATGLACQEGLACFSARSFSWHLEVRV